MVKILSGTVFCGNVSNLAANDNARVRTTIGREVRDNHNFIVIARNDDYSFVTPVYSNEGSQRIRLEPQFATGGWMQHGSFIHPRQVWRFPHNTLRYKFAEVGSYAVDAPAEISRLIQAINNFEQDAWRLWPKAA